MAMALVSLIAFFVSFFIRNKLRAKKISLKKALIACIVLFFIFITLGSSFAPSLPKTTQATTKSTVKPTSTTTSKQMTNHQVKQMTVKAAPTLRPTKKLRPTPTNSPTLAYDSNGFPLNAHETSHVIVSQIAKEPSQYNNKWLIFTCDVASFAKGSSGNATAINCSDPNDITSIIQIDASGWDLTQINQGDTINVYGQGEGSFSGQNAFGTTVQESLVFGLYFNDTTNGNSNSK